MNQFNTQQNKGLLWNILQNGGKFNNLPSNFDVKTVFENHIRDVSSRARQNTKLIDLNKHFISSFVTDISRFESPDIIKKNRADNFNNNLKQQEDNFNSAMARPMPKTVDFSDKEDEPITDIESLIAKQLEKRNLDIPSIDNNDTAAVQDWLNGNSNSIPGGQNNKNIKIGEELENIENSIIDLNTKKPTRKSEKRVTWNDEKKESNLPDLTSLNKEDAAVIQDKTIHDALLKILKNQDYIINAIHDLQDRI